MSVSSASPVDLTSSILPANSEQTAEPQPVYIIPIYIAAGSVVLLVAFVIFYLWKRYQLKVRLQQNNLALQTANGQGSSANLLAPVSDVQQLPNQQQPPQQQPQVTVATVQPISAAKMKLHSFGLNDHTHSGVAVSDSMSQSIETNSREISLVPSSISREVSMVPTHELSAVSDHGNQPSRNVANLYRSPAANVYPPPGSSASESSVPPPIPQPAQQQQPTMIKAQMVNTSSQTTPQTPPQIPGKGPSAYPMFQRSVLQHTPIGKVIQPSNLEFQPVSSPTGPLVLSPGRSQPTSTRSSPFTTRESGPDSRSSHTASPNMTRESPDPGQNGGPPHPSHPSGAASSGGKQLTKSASASSVNNLPPISIPAAPSHAYYTQQQPRTMQHSSSSRSLIALRPQPQQLVQVQNMSNVFHAVQAAPAQAATHNVNSASSTTGSGSAQSTMGSFNGGITAGSTATLGSISGGATGVDMGNSTISSSSVSHTGVSFSLSPSSQTGTYVGPPELCIPGFICVVEGQDFRRKKKLATGGNAEVYSCEITAAELKNRASGDKLVCKLIKNAQLERQRSTAMQLFHQEVAMMWFLRGHINIVRMHGFCEVPAMILIKYYSLGALSHLIRGRYIQTTRLSMTKEWYTKRSMVTLMLDVAYGLLAMHDAGFVHCDVKDGNVLLDYDVDQKRLVAVITDMGISQVVSTKSLQVKAFRVIAVNGASILYAAPEAIQELRGLIMPLMDERQVKARDVYSLAMMMGKMMTRRNLWQLKHGHNNNNNNR